MNQTIGVNITPQSFQPTLHFSQGDVGRVFVVNVTDYDIPTGATVTCVATKPSGMGFTVSGTVSGNSVTFTSTAEMTDEWGRFPAEIRIASGNTLLGTANFLMIGEKDPHPASTIDGTQEELIPQLTLLVNRVEAAAESVHDLTVSATTLAAGSDATATYDSTNNSIAFGIPRGADGDVTRSEFNDLKSDLTQLNQNAQVIKLSAYIDATTTKIMSDANSATYLFDISTDASVIDAYIVQITGTNNRCRLLAFTASIDDVEIGSVGAYTAFDNSTKKLVLNKSTYASYKTLAIATNYQSTPVADLSVIKHHAYPVWDDIEEQSKEIKGLQSGMAYPSEGSVVIADSVMGAIQFESIPVDDCTVTAIGTNLFNYQTAEIGTISSSTGEDDNTYLRSIRSEDYVPIIEGATYCASSNTLFYQLRLALYDENKNYISRIEKPCASERYKADITIPTGVGAKYARFFANFGDYISNHSKIKGFEIMFSYGYSFPQYEAYETSSVTVEDGEVSGTLESYNGTTTIFASTLETLYLKVPTKLANIIAKYHPAEDQFTENECRTRFRLEMAEKAKRIGMNDTIVGDGAGHPVQTTITALDAIKMLCHAMSYQEIANTWSYDTKIIRTKGVENEITMDSTLFKDTYISDLTDYYTVLGFKTGSGSTHNLVCACTDDDLDGKVLVGCICLSQVTDDANVNRPKAMKTLMDMGKTLVANRSADVSAYVSAMTAMTATRFTVVLLPNCSTKLLQRYDFEGSYSMLYNYSSNTFTSWSMIKLLCAMTALDFLYDLEEENAVVYSDLLIGTGAYGPLFQEGEIITYRDALSALLIPSCNQAAYFLERLVGKRILEHYGEDGFLPTEE